MPPPSQAVTDSMKQKSNSTSGRSPNHYSTSSTSTSTSSPSYGATPGSPLSPRSLPWNIAKRTVVNGQLTTKRITLAERAGAGGRSAVPTSTTKSAHARSVSTGIGRSTSTAASTFSKSVGGRPNSSLGMSKGSAIPTGARPASAQGFRHPGGGESASENGAKSAVKRKHTDIKGRLEDTEAAIAEMREIQAQERIETMSLKEQLEDHKLRGEEEPPKGISREVYTNGGDTAYQLETTRVTLETQNTQAQFELESYQKRTAELERILGDERRARAAERDDASKRLRDETDEIRRRLRDEMDGIVRSHREALETLERRARNDLEDEKSARAREVQEMKMQAAMEKQRMELEMDGSGRDLRTLKTELETARMELENGRSELQREKAMSASLRDSLSEQSGATLTLESSSRALRARVEALESDGRTQANSYAELEEKLRQSYEEARIAQEKLRAEETLRRKLHNQVQELKGNIRVFCRVRPTLPSESETPADIRFPNAGGENREIEVMGATEKSAMGNVVTKNYPFQFDKVFGPATHNPDVFEEISQLVQSALDGYNVCIFCYGQTGSGKTYTMSSEDGMIPRAVHQIYATAKELEEKGWSYKMEGSFVEVYNENINDLLGQADDFDKKKHEIRHDPKELKTTITDINTVTLDNPAKVESILRRASQTRSVAATKANERSSRSHSVFILKLIGLNSVTGERSEGTLNLVDLAGSERLSHSQSTGERLKETQNINRSLSCLGDVIAALGNGKENSHIPYRNSKLTYLLQYSLGGNSKCLMFVMVSPMQAHLNETLTSLKFATKVNNTSIGTAKRQAKVTG
ncbi:unnamed protein product [Tuber aestivum]|uniref:Kinesin-like protein n=1 Tax=Tuber aestivum TaxID=59557 RepID=A0A292Q6A1_9PEZI|nr:unnamed protein product [Tuber aestivum]